MVSFFKEGTLFTADGDATERLVQDGANFLLYSVREGVIENYHADGRLLSMHGNDGRSIAFTYGDAGTSAVLGLLTKIRDAQRGSLLLSYDPATGKLATLALEESPQETVALHYDSSGRLSSITYPDGSSKSLAYANAAYPHALTSMTHEDGVSRSVYTYDAKGRAITSGMDGLSGISIAYQGDPSITTTENYAPSTRVLTRVHEWTVPGSVAVTRPNGSISLQTFKSVQGYPRLHSSGQPAGSGCGAATQTQELDANGNVTQRDDFNGNRTCHTYDSSRNLEATRVEGLANTASCSSVTPSGAELPAGSRKVSTQWHPDWRLQTKIAEPKKITTSVYNGQPDPFNGGSTASCAPSSALLPDGKPIVVLCKQVEQATTDTNGSQGFSAALQSGVPARVWQYSYNEFGQVLSTKDPLGNTSTNSYYATTTPEYTKGDLKSVTNALGQVTQYTKYNPHGQVLTMVDANQVTTTYTYDLRQRLTSVSTAGATTAYAYWPTGLLKQVTQPDQSAINYEYDDAHRLVAVADSTGNRIEYSLDNAGNKIGEQVKDPGGVLTRQLARVMDALGRVQQVTGRE